MLLAIAMPVFSWFLFVTPDVAIRAAIAAAAIALICAFIAWTMLYRLEAGMMQTQAFLGLIFGMLSTCMAWAYRWSTRCPTA